MVDPAAAARQGLQPCSRDATDPSRPALDEDESVSASFPGVRMVLGGAAGGPPAGESDGALVVTTR